MRNTLAKIVFFAAIILPAFDTVFGQVNESSLTEHASPRFSENKGQWNSDVLFRMRFNTGSLFLEQDNLTFVFVDGNDLDNIYHAHHAIGSDTCKLKGHAY